MKRKINNDEKYIREIQYNKNLILEDIVKNINLKNYNIAKNLISKYKISIHQIYKYTKSKDELIKLFDEKEYNKHNQLILTIKKNEIKKSKIDIYVLTFSSISLMFISIMTIYYSIVLSTPIRTIYFSIFISVLAMIISITFGVWSRQSHLFYKKNKSKILS